jgi:hypothetical protein
MAPPGGGVERQFVSKLSHKIGGNSLKIKPYSSRFGTAKKPVWVVHECVFFTQHLPEKRRQDLWEGRFFIA